MEKQIEHIKNNLILFRSWVANSEHLQPSMDVLRPVIGIYNAQFPNQAIGTSACKECLLDMIRWAIGLTKEKTETETKTETKLKTKKK